ncbi:MAG: hypothetical protein R6U85_03085, partial [Salinivirgaceae bacterium]
RRGIFIITGIVDFLYPLIYGPLLALLLSRFVNNLDCTISGKLIILVPFVAVLFDYIENAGIIFMIADYPNMNIAIAWLTSIAGILKWLVTGVCIATLLMLLIKIAQRRIKHTV